MKKILIVYGGQSTEHQVSCNSVFSVLKVIDYRKYNVDLVYISQEGEWFIKSEVKAPLIDINQLNNYNKSFFDFNSLSMYDVVLPVLHGEKGEDGTIQGLFEIFDVPYIGNGVYASAVSINKIFTKKICRLIEIPQVESIYFDKKDWFISKEKLLIEINNMGYPLFVKPPTMGSSIGISKVKDKDSLFEAIEHAFSYGEKVLIEKGIKARELEIGVLEKNGEIVLSEIGEVSIDSEFHDYNSKYESSATKLILPALINNDIKDKVEDFALKIFKEFDCKGLARVDFFLDENGDVYFNEINTFPGFTETSVYPRLWLNQGITYSQLIDIIISSAIKKNEVYNSII